MNDDCTEPRCVMRGALHDYEHRDSAGRSWERHDVVSPADGYVASVGEIRALRDRTGHPLGLCKRALERFTGDLELAYDSIPTRRAAA